MNVRIAHLGVAHIICSGLTPAGHALQVLEAADHAELEAEISATAVNRVALENDRIVRAIQAPGGLIVEHDPVRGDIYVRVSAKGGTGLAPGALADSVPLTLYIGTERGLTYRLSMSVAERDSAQILIRNGAVAMTDAERGSRANSYTGELVELIRAVARNEPPPGYLIGPGPAASGPAIGGRAPGGPSAGVNEEAVTLVETWRGGRYAASVFSVPVEAGLDAETLAARTGGNALAAWVSDGSREFDGAFRAAVVETNAVARTAR